MKALSITAFLFLPCLLAAESGTGSLDLAQAQTQAAALNPALKKLAAQVSAAEARTWQPLAGYLPRIDVSAQHLFTAQYGIMGVVFGGEDISFPAAFPQTTLDAHIQWTLFDGLRCLELWKGANAEVRASRMERDYAAFHLRQDVAIRFYRALAAQMLADVAAQNVSTLDDHLALAKDYEETGDATHFSVLRIRAQREEAVAGSLQATDQAGLAREDLAQAIGLSADARSLTGTLPVPHFGDVPDGAAPDLARRKDLEALRQREQALERKRGAILSEWSPTVYLFGDKQFYQYGDFDARILASNGFPSLEMTGLGLSWNLFDGGLDRARLSEANADILASEDGLASAALAARRDFDSWKRRYRDNTRLYEARLSVLDQCVESVRLAKMGLEAGSLTNSEMLDAELDLFRARAGVVQAQADAAEARLNIELLRGGD